MKNSKIVIRVLEKVRDNIDPILGFDLNKLNLFAFDFSDENQELKNIDLQNTRQFTEYIIKKMRDNDTTVAIGKYNENRTIYARSELFGGIKHPRTIHLGIDLWTRAETPVFAPLPGVVHSFQNNNQFGDFGPTIILEHNIENIIFYTLYGHLTLESLSGMKNRLNIAKGQQFAKIGNFPINGNWPPHLHFQIITDMMDKKGDFYGVVSLAERDRFLQICPDPNYILKIDSLI